MEQEIWKDIIGYEGIYQISSLGRVKSVSRYVNHINGVRHVHIESGCRNIFITDEGFV